MARADLSAATMITIPVVVTIPFAGVAAHKLFIAPECPEEVGSP